MYYVYEKNVHDEDFTACEVSRTEDRNLAFSIAKRRLMYGIEVFIYLDDVRIWAVTSA